jgi:hypothetical protein
MELKLGEYLVRDGESFPIKSWILTQEITGVLARLLIVKDGALESVERIEALPMRLGRSYYPGEVTLRW